MFIYPGFVNTAPGSGTSKKLAKRNAAAKMLSRIHDVPVDPRTNNEAELEDDTFTIVRNKRVTCTYENLLCTRSDYKSSAARSSCRGHLR